MFRGLTCIHHGRKHVAGRQAGLELKACILICRPTGRKRLRHMLGLGCALGISKLTPQ